MINIKTIWAISACGLLCISSIAMGQARDLYTDSWVATDGLGRTLPGYSEVGPRESDKYVGMFYFLWHGEHGTDLYDNTKIIAENPSNPQWGPDQAFHWWGEPEAGYYLATDPWVIRRNASMLVDAGVDMIYIDVTNGWTYEEEFNTLAQTYQQIRSEGGKTPQFAFLSHAYSPDIIRRLYNNIYSKDLYSDLWFQWQGKPLMLGYPNQQLSDGSYLDPAIKDFFTFRESWAWDAGQDKWQWLDTYPQDYGWHQLPWIPEQIPVGVASHPMNNNIGTSYHDGNQPAIDEYGLCATTGEGQHFAEQSGRALSVDPEMVFVTGWNEWVAQRQIANDEGYSFLGQPLSPGDTYFIDTYNEEYNRDIVPMKGGHTDNYYYQLVDFVRRYKGMDAPQPPTASRTVSIDGNFADWNSVTSEYRDTVGDTAHRDWDGWGGLHYTNTTGRNDIITSKVASDASRVYFYVETNENMTSHTDENWMMLFIDSDLDSQTGWNGYNYAVNMEVIDSDTTTLKRTTDGVNWETVAALDFKVTGNMMEIGIPRYYIDAIGDIVSFNFHWADNMQELNDISQFFINGDSAPNRRFDYNYQSVAIPITLMIPGDANWDGVVDEQDAALLSINWLKMSWATWGDGDFNNDGKVNEEDASILAANWLVGASSSTSVPEPSMIVILAGMMFVVIGEFTARYYRLR